MCACMCVCVRVSARARIFECLCEGFGLWLCEITVCVLCVRVCLSV